MKPPDGTSLIHRPRKIKLVDEAMFGEEFVIAKAGKPVAKLVPFPNTHQRQLGVLRGKVKIANDFDEPLLNDMIADFEGKHD